MQISSVATQTSMRTEPAKPQAPTPPAGGNVENRQPPAKPSRPAASGSGGFSSYA